MFKETSEGQTHSQNDGCGELAHNHAFALSHINTEPANQGASDAIYFYQRVAYVVCEKCGEVKKNYIQRMKEETPKCNSCGQSMFLIDAIGRTVEIIGQTQVESKMPDGRTEFKYVDNVI